MSATNKIEIQTYLFINVGITGLYDKDKQLSEVKLIIIPVSKEQLKNKNVNVDECALFDFMPIDTHSAGSSLKSYKLKFSIEEYERLVAYIKSFPGPVALAAYNGYNYAFPILYNAIKGYCGLTPELRCVDLMQGVFELENKFGPQNPRDDGKFPWEFKKDDPFRDYTFSEMYRRTLGKDSGVDESIQGRTKADGDEGLPLPKLRATVRWAAEYQPISAWLELVTSYTYFKDFTC